MKVVCSAYPAHNSADKLSTPIQVLQPGYKVGCEHKEAAIAAYVDIMSNHSNF